MITDIDDTTTTIATAPSRQPPSQHVRPRVITIHHRNAARPATAIGHPPDHPCIQPPAAMPTVSHATSRFKDNERFIENQISSRRNRTIACHNIPHTSYQRSTSTATILTGTMTYTILYDCISNRLQQNKIISSLPQYNISRHDQVYTGTYSKKPAYITT